MLLATMSNMRTVENLSGVFMYSPHTGERFSASPGDYWSRTTDEPFTDSEGEPMILVTESHVYQPVRYGFNENGSPLQDYTPER